MARRITFPFAQRPSLLFGSVSRPLAVVALWSQKTHGWIRAVMLVDTGADYSLLPNVYASHLGIALDRDGRVFETMGIGGRERVYVVNRWPMPADRPTNSRQTRCPNRYRLSFFRQTGLDEARGAW